MSTPSATPSARRLRPSPATLAWLPLAVVVVACLASFITGRSGVERADAASVVGVTGSIPADLFVDATNCTAASVAIGDLIPGDPWKTAVDEGGQVCSLDFGTTNHALGTTMSMLEDPGAPATPTDAMKCVGATCTGDALTDFQNISAEPAGGTSAFGAQLISSGGTATGLWNPAPGVYDVEDTATPACSTPAVGTGTCAFTWGATVNAADAPGAYQAQARMVVLAN